VATSPVSMASPRPASGRARHTAARREQIAGGGTRSARAGARTRVVRARRLSRHPGNYPRWSAPSSWRRMPTRACRTRWVGPFSFGFHMIKYPDRFGSDSMIRRQPPNNSSGNMVLASGPRGSSWSPTRSPCVHPAGLFTLGPSGDLVDTIKRLGVSR